MVYECEHLKCGFWNKVWRQSLVPQNVRSSLSSPKLFSDVSAHCYSGKDRGVVREHPGMWVRTVPISAAECLLGICQDEQRRPASLCGFSGSCPLVYSQSKKASQQSSGLLALVFSGTSGMANMGLCAIALGHWSHPCSASLTDTGCRRMPGTLEGEPHQGLS